MGDWWNPFSWGQPKFGEVPAGYDDYIAGGGINPQAGPGTPGYGGIGRQLTMPSPQIGMGIPGMQNRPRIDMGLRTMGGDRRGIGGRITEGIGKAGRWAGENPELAGIAVGGIASAIGAHQEGKAADREFKMRKEQLAWERQQEEERLKRRREAAARMRKRWAERGWGG